MKFLSFFLLLLCCACAKKTESSYPHNFTEVLIEDIATGDRSVRAIEVDDEMVFYAGDLGKHGSYDISNENVIYEVQDNDPIKDSIATDGNPVTKRRSYRSIVATKDAYFVLSIGSPGRLVRVDKSTHKQQEVYVEEHPKVFYDSMDFWNDNEGIAMGDPIDDCLSVIITRDGGTSWKKLDCEQFPKSIEGEAAFAASDTNIKIIGDHTWIVSGGKASRVYYSGDKGNTWEVYDTPIVQGKETQGAYTMDFYDVQNGIIYGGDYTAPEANANNVAITMDGGKTWKMVASGTNQGYKSCVQFVPRGEGKELVALGFTGISYSKDGGNTWTAISDESFLSFRFLNDSVGYAGGRNRVSKLTFR